jgi:uncharacterized protein YodC (DUF2158 family)
MPLRRRRDPFENAEIVTLGESKMPNNNFKVGDVVILKSGGPKMTIHAVGTDVHGKPMVRCTWFPNFDAVKQDFFRGFSQGRGLAWLSGRDSRSGPRCL